MIHPDSSQSPSPKPSAVPCFLRKKRSPSPPFSYLPRLRIESIATILFLHHWPRSWSSSFTGYPSFTNNARLKDVSRLLAASERSQYSASAPPIVACRCLRRYLDDYFRLQRRHDMLHYGELRSVSVWHEVYHDTNQETL